ncbi:MAG: class I SAM-dependent methyltransferase [Proteobacteria bacterium]|nr:class I SAM-dependent methyltransferase [Pseudomonadota bacterium]
MDEIDRSAAVQAQYESYPYPARDPADEAKRLVTGSPSHLLEIAHYLNAGHLDPDEPFRALVAGGGTGDATIMLAQQLVDAGVAAGTVTYLDMSTASRAIAEARAAARGLTNIRFVTGEIEAVGHFCPGPYDYIDCCGVLHHLADPEQGLRALAAQLTAGGGMGLMVYGALGRRGVYDIQDAMRLLADGDGDTDRLVIVRRLLEGLPQSHWLRQNPFVGDHFQGGEAGLYDLLLHRRDRAYTVPELLAFLQAGGLRPVGFIAPAQYDPRCFLTDPDLGARAVALPQAEQWALAERLSGALTKHIVYAVPAARADDPVARLDMNWREMTPVFRDLDPAVVARGIRGGGELKADLAPGQPYRAPLPTLAPAIAALVDGRRTLGGICEALRVGDDAGPDDDMVFRQFEVFYQAFSGINRLLLRC